MTEPQKFRYDFYQSDDALYFTLYFRDIKKGDCTVTGQPGEVTINFKGPDAVDHSLTIYPYGEVKVEGAQIQYRGIKLTITFPKKVAVCETLVVCTYTFLIGTVARTRT